MKKVIVFVAPALLLLSMIPCSLVSSDYGIELKVKDSSEGLTVEPMDDVHGAPQEKIDALVEQLGSKDIDKRLAARNALLRIGAPARKALQKALKNQDLEVSFAADSILRALDKIRFIARCRTTDSSSLKGKFLEVEIYPISNSADQDEYHYYDLDSMLKNSVTLPIPANGVVFLPPMEPERCYYIRLSIDGYDKIGEKTPRLQGMPVLVTAVFSPGIRIERTENPSKANPSKNTHTITGRVVDVKNDNAPVEDCNLSGGYNVSDVSDTDGTFKIEGAQIKKYLYVYKEGWRLVDIEWKKLEGGNWEATVKMMEEKWFRGKLAATILKPDGTPLAETKYQVFNYMKRELDLWRWRYDSTVLPKTGKDGSIEVERDIDDTGNFIIYVPGYVPIDLTDYKLKGNETVTLEKPLTLSRGRMIDISVVDDRGKLVKNALVVINYPEFDCITIETYNLEEYCRPELEKMIEFDPRYYKTDGKGEVRITGLAEKQFNLRVFAIDHMPSALESVKIKPDENPAAKKISLTRACKITIRQKDGARNFRSVALSKHEDDESFSKDGGIFCCFQDDSTRHYDRETYGNLVTHSYLKPGKHSFVVYASNRKSVGVCRELKAGDDVTEEVTLEKIQYGSIAGKIKFGHGIERKDIGEAHLGLADGRDGLTPLRLCVDEDGGFSIKGVAEGRNYISVRHRDGGLLAFYAVDILAGKVSQVEIEVALARVKGVLYDAAGVPQAMRPIKICRLPNISPEEMKRIPDSAREQDKKKTKMGIQSARRVKWTDNQTTNLKGEFTFDSLVAGTYLVSSDQTPLGMVVEVRPGENTIDVRPIQTSISGKVTGLGGRAAQVRLLRVYHDPENVGVLARKCFVGKDGSFKLEQVPPGDYMVVAVVKDIPIKCVARVAVKDATPITGVELAWPDKSSLRVLKGRIKDYAPPRITEGCQYLEASSYVIISGPYRGVAKIKVDGTFEVKLPAGKYKIAISGRHLDTHNSAQVARVYEITVDAEKPVTEVVLPISKPEPAPQPEPEKETPAPEPTPEEKTPAPQPAPAPAPAPEPTPEPTPAPEKDKD